MAITYLKAYAVLESNIANEFIPQSKLVKSGWVKDSSNGDIQLIGEWHEKGFSTTTANFFIVSDILDSKGTSLFNGNLKISLDDICKTYFQQSKINSISRIEYYASNYSLGYEYPILSLEDYQGIVAIKQPFDYSSILRFALASEYAYEFKLPSEEVSKKVFHELFGQLNKETSNSHNWEGLNNWVKDNNQDLKDLHAWTVRGGNNVNSLYAWIVDAPSVPTLGLNREVIVAFRGTNSKEHLLEDAKLMIQNFIETNKNWQKESYLIVEQAIYYAIKNNILDSNGNPNIVITGHSLGGYTAIQTAFRFNIKSRVFSSPATKTIESYSDGLSNTLFKKQSINFVRNKDLVVAVSGRHEENMVYFPESSYINPLSNHSISNFIKEIFLPNHLKQKNNQGTIVSPGYAYIYPTALLGSGLNQVLNIWGKF